MLKPYKVYKHTFPNGKIYIGITKQTLTKRKSNGYYHNQDMQKAIWEYGWSSIYSEVLFDNLTKKTSIKKRSCINQKI